ncbi:hypothetical protein GSI_12363 [Ganoderma sinense ZZ0214-1]|uniref:Uncharacterized protein n=1 Tax=Ganoderma sinense ZZ0214-1 TaxID=1077348 RepID=A0A2G8RYM4_9APHY|nr:hypothetical protein GSI_12363 [Ganoderma sinense ZZ0214-1]
MRESSGADDSDSNLVKVQPALTCGAWMTISKLWRVLSRTLKRGGSVDKVVLMRKYCDVCDRVYETVGADEIGDGELEEGTSYY